MNKYNLNTFDNESYYRISGINLNLLNRLHHLKTNNSLDIGRIQGFIIGIGFSLLITAMIYIV